VADREGEPAVNPQREQFLRAGPSRGSDETIGETPGVARATPIDSERFDERYAASGATASLAVEAEALGTDYQVNGYATIEQVDEMGRQLHLGPDSILLDLGAGCGWPGLYLADRLGCAVISTDPIASGIQVARRRALADGLHGRSLVIQANAIDLPLRSASVDAVVHTDLMC
jgi:hypothetical protein